MVVSYVYPTGTGAEVMAGKTEGAQWLIREANRRKVTLLAMDRVPRVTAAQKLDSLSTAGKITGHRAVIEAMYLLQRFAVGEITASGKFPPAKLLVIGAGVAGLAATGACRTPQPYVGSGFGYGIHLGCCQRALSRRPLPACCQGGHISRRLVGCFPKLDPGDTVTHFVTPIRRSSRLVSSHIRFHIGADCGAALTPGTATARGLGCDVRCFDTRAECEEQVQSLGARFLTLRHQEQTEGGGGYAKQMSAAFLAREMALFEAQVALDPPSSG